MNILQMIGLKEQGFGWRYILSRGHLRCHHAYANANYPPDIANAMLK